MHVGSDVLCPSVRPCLPLSVYPSVCQPVQLPQTCLLPGSWVCCLQVVTNALAATTRRAGRRGGSASSLQPRAIGPFFLFSVLQLGTQVARSEYRPPLTLGVMIAQTLSYLRPGWLKMFLRVGRPVRGGFALTGRPLEIHFH